MRGRGKNTMEKQMDFFEQNDKLMCERLAKILVWMTLVFPALFILSAIGVFQIQYSDLAILSIPGCICTIGPTILQKVGVPVSKMKYISVLAVGFVVMLLGGNYYIGIYMTYGLAMLFSCMFFDKKFTLKIAIISYFFLLISLYLRSFDANLFDYSNHVQWFISYAAGFTIEQVVMGAVFVSLAKSCRSILEKLHSANRVKEVVETCGQASSELVGMTAQLAQNMDESRRVNQSIVSSAQDTAADCSRSLEHVSGMQESVGEMIRLIGAINERTGETLEISDKIWQRMQNYAAVMNDAVESMQGIEKTANFTGESVRHLENVVAEISTFTNEISAITSKTNMLALNASIEAARAGEQGKGFSVVAEQIRVLAESSKQSSISIKSVVDHVLEMLEQVKKSNEQNLISVNSGIARISDARQEAQELGQMQEDSRGKTQQIAESSNVTQQHSRQVQEMAEEMANLVENSLNRAGSIVEEANHQEKITDMVGNAFSGVDQMARKLYELSQMEGEGSC